MTTTATDDFLTMAEVAALTRVPQATLAFWRSQRSSTAPRSLRLGRQVVYRRSDVDAWIADRDRETGSGGR